MIGTWPTVRGQLNGSFPPGATSPNSRSAKTAIRHLRQSLPADGTWMIVEPIADDRVEDNFNPIGRAHYGFSTLLCTPASLSQDVGLALGGQAGESRIATWSLGRAWLLPPRQRDAVQHRLRGQAVASALVRSSSQTGPGQSRRR
jgi:hypothetical protein